MDEPLLGARRLRALLQRHGVRPTKSLGQNFVIDPNTIRKIVDVSGVGADDDVLEVGAGAGSLTLGLASVARRVVAVEFDRRLIAVLSEVLEGVGNVEVVHEDALRADLGAHGAGCLVGNLPYNIATPLVLKALAEAPGLRSLTVMTQAEVGQRLAASPGSRSYGAASVMVALRARARVAARISRSVFYPVPGVDSVLVTLERGPALPGAEAEGVDRIVRAAFGQRRKMLRASLIPVAGSSAAARAWLDRAGLDPAARPEEIDVEGFLALARQL